MPAISVIVPVYKVEKYIHRCVDSILGQTYEDFELILVDDGSPDDCGAICDEYAAKDSRVVVIHQENGGLSAARNAGIDWAFANSDSQWISFIDSDDWVHREYLQRLLDAATSNDAAMCACRFVVKADCENSNSNIDDAYTVVYQPEDYFILKDPNHSEVSACMKIYRKELFTSLRYPVGKLHEDLFLTHKVVFSVQRVAFVHADMYYYFQNSDSITRSKWSKKRLDEVVGYRELLVFLNRRGFERAYEVAARRFLCRLCFQCEKLKKSEYANHPVYSCRLRMEVLLLVLSNPRIFCRTFNKDRWMYAQAFPRLMHIYWMGHAFVNRLKKGLQSWKT